MTRSIWLWLGNDLVSDFTRSTDQVQCIVNVNRGNSLRNSISPTKQNRQCFNSIRNSLPDDSERRNSKNMRFAKSRHHRARSVLPHSQEPSNSSRSTACCFRTAQATRRVVPKLIKMFDEIHQHFKQFLSQRTSHFRTVEKGEWACYGENSILSCLSINNTFNLSHLVFLTGHVPEFKIARALFKIS